MIWIRSDESRSQCTRFVKGHAFTDSMALVLVAFEAFIDLRGESRTQLSDTIVRVDRGTVNELYGERFLKFERIFLVFATCNDVSQVIEAPDWVSRELLEPFARISASDCDPLCCRKFRLLLFVFERMKKHAFKTSTPHQTEQTEKNFGKL